MGSAGARGPRKIEHLYDYRLNHARVLAATIAFGAYQPPWENATTLNSPAVGQFEADLFDPIKWKPMYPNPAFQNMTDRDGFWATKILMNFSDEDLAAIVKEAQFTDPKVTAYVLETLIARRRKIGQTWFNRLAPLDNFEIQIEGDRARLSFDDLAVKAGMLKQADQVYQLQLKTIDAKQPRLPDMKKSIGQFDLPLAAMQKSKRWVATVSIQSANAKTAAAKIDVIIDTNPQPLVVGIKRRYLPLQ
jgi:hypothetical protein